MWTSPIARGSSDSCTAASIRYCINYYAWNYGYTYQETCVHVSGTAKQQELTCAGSDETSSLQPLSTYVFQVRPEGSNNEFGDWSEMVQRFIGKDSACFHAWSS